MRNLISILLISVLTLPTYGQNTVDDILSTNVNKELIYEPEIKSGEQLYLKMAYGSSFISNQNDIKKLYGAKFASVDIVFSDHPKGDSYPKLTRKRIENLKKLYPTLFSKKDIKWRLVRQTNCSDQQSAKKLFHGIVITYRPAQSKEDIKKEIEYLKDILSELSKGTSEAVAIEKIIDEEEEYLSETIKPDSVGTKLSSPLRIAPGTYPGFTDSTVTTVLKRQDWTNMLIISDLTGSMSPYTAQLFVWLRLNTIDEKVKQFVFFNDGDKTPDHKKVIGKTGGIYQTRSSKFGDIEELAYKTMRNGCGGDAPENDIEALTKAIELCPDCENIILIADNWAPIKDISLLSNINKPIKIILCGSDYGINAQYLDLARATGGSVHIMENDLIDLMKINEGETITIRGQTFKIENGKFTRVTKI
ncbi:hypothetical protein [Brumimicrobium salinarum]|nr:hypothetical protein [Brumimicrobium salinarum]